jgi:hypothetical protein
MGKTVHGPDEVRSIENSSCGIHGWLSGMQEVVIAEITTSVGLYKEKPPLIIERRFLSLEGNIPIINFFISLPFLPHRIELKDDIYFFSIVYFFLLINSGWQYVFEISSHNLPLWRRAWEPSDSALKKPIPL